MVVTSNRLAARRELGPAPDTLLLPADSWGLISSRMSRAEEHALTTHAGSEKDSVAVIAPAEVA